MFALSPAHASTTKGISADGPVPNDAIAARRGIGPVGEQVGTDRAEPLRLDLLARYFRATSSSRGGLLAADIAAGHAAQSGFGNDLASPRASTAIEVRHQFAHEHVAARRQQLVKLRGVVPLWRRLAGVGDWPAPSPLRLFAQCSAFASFGIAGPKLISILVPTWVLTGFTLTTVVDPSRSGRSSIRLPPVVTTSEPSDARTAPATTRRPLPSAPRVGSRNSLVETIGLAMLNRRAISSGVPSMPGPSSSTK